MRNEVKNQIKKIKKEVIKPAQEFNQQIIASLFGEIQSLKEGIREALEDKSELSDKNEFLAKLYKKSREALEKFKKENVSFKANLDKLKDELSAYTKPGSPSNS